MKTWKHLTAEQAMAFDQSLRHLEIAIGIRAVDGAWTVTMVKALLISLQHAGANMDALRVEVDGDALVVRAEKVRPDILD